MESGWSGAAGWHGDGTEFEDNIPKTHIHVKKYPPRIRTTMNQEKFWKQIWKPQCIYHKIIKDVELVTLISDILFNLYIEKF